MLTLEWLNLIVNILHLLFIGKQAVNKLLENGKNQWNYRIFGVAEQQK
jgi:hypothetical protein